MYDRDRGICAQNAANAAATVVAALAQRPDIEPNTFTHEYFEAWRKAIAEKTWSMAQAKDPTPQPVPPASVPEYDESPFGPAPAPATPPSAPVSTPPPTPTGPMCPHGERVFKTGVSNQTGKSWRAWFCPLPKGAAGVCDVQWV